MTSRETYTGPDRTVVISPDARLSAGRLAQSIISVQLSDEHTGQPPSTEVVAQTAFPLVTPKSTVDGLAGLTGFPVRAMPLLRTFPCDIDFAVHARRYLPFTTTVHFVNQGTFPDTFTPRDLGQVRLHRQSTVLCGRVVRNTATGILPVAGASVSISGYWVAIPSPASVVPPTAANLVSLRPGIYIDRSAGTAQIRRRDLIATADVSELMDDAPAGSTTWRVSNRVGLAPGEILSVDSSDVDRTEYVIVQTVTGSSVATQPAQVTLRYAGRLDHRPAAHIERVTLAAPGPDNAFIADAVPGDAVVLTAALSGIAGASTVEIDDGIAAPEYHAVSLFSVTSDADGFYRLPALNRTGQLELTVIDGVHPPVVIIVVPNYELDQNNLDIALN